MQSQKTSKTLQQHLQRIQSLGGQAAQQKRSKKNRHEFARRGGLASAEARMSKMTKEQRSKIAKKAAGVRWRRARLKAA